MGEELELWACKELDKLGLPDAGIIVQYLGPLEKPKEVEDYLSSMLDISQKSHREFISEFVDRQAQSKVDKRFYRKKEEGETHNHVKGKKKKHTGSDSNDSMKGNEKSKNKQSEVNANDEAENKPSSDLTQVGKKKKNKFVNLYSEDDVVMLSGRHVCECLASKHNLINNCLSCGRIVCEQEGAGPCFFCSTMVKSKYDVNSANDKKNGKSKNGANIKNITEDAKKAIEHKNKLLEFDRTSVKRTKVLDDECDYFNSESKWISAQDRQILQAKEKEMKEKKYSRSNKKAVIDLMGRQIVEVEDHGVFDPEDPVVKAVLEKQQSDIFSEFEKHSLPPPATLIKPVYTSKEDQTVNKFLQVSPVEIPNQLNRLQDKELQEMTDQGKCLSMHQPWASLLVAGIKMHEGRSWYTSHRGRLWIASAAKAPASKDIEDMENFYRMWGGEDSSTTFPKHYPPGCLLGCVDVVDVLPQEEYRIKFPEGESDSPFVFICEGPREMIFKFPIKGQHKIFSVDSKIHKAAKKALQ